MRFAPDAPHDSPELTSWGYRSERHRQRLPQEEGLFEANFSDRSLGSVMAMPERAVLVVPVLAGLGLSMALLSVGVTPLTIRVRAEQVVEQLTTKAEFVPVLRQQLAAIAQEERDQQLTLAGAGGGTSSCKRSWRDSMICASNVAIYHQTGAVERSRRRCGHRVRKLHLQPGVESLNRGRRSLLNRGGNRSASLTVKARPGAGACNRWNIWRSCQISEMNVREQNRQTEDGIDKPEVVIDHAVGYGRQPIWTN